MKTMSRQVRSRSRAEQLVRQPASAGRWFNMTTMQSDVDAGGGWPQVNVCCQSSSHMTRGSQSNVTVILSFTSSLHSGSDNLISGLLLKIDSLSICWWKLMMKLLAPHKHYNFSSEQMLHFVCSHWSFKSSQILQQPQGGRAKAVWKTNNQVHT